MGQERGIFASDASKECVRRFSKALAMRDRRVVMERLVVLVRTNAEILGLDRDRDLGSRRTVMRERAGERLGLIEFGIRAPLEINGDAAFEHGKEDVRGRTQVGGLDNDADFGALGVGGGKQGLNLVDGEPMEWIQKRIGNGSAKTTNAGPHRDAAKQRLKCTERRVSTAQGGRMRAMNATVTKARRGRKMSVEKGHAGKGGNQEVDDDEKRLLEREPGLDLVFGESVPRGLRDLELFDLNIVLENGESSTLR